MGFDDLGISAYMAPPLTTLRQSARDIGRIAVEGMRALLDGQVPSMRLPPPELVVRESTQRPRPGE
jgi:LacI family transcriptional regulator